MKSPIHATPIVLAVLISAMAIPFPAIAQTTAFTYQGWLDDGENPADGSYDLRFILHGDATLPGFEVGLPQTLNAVAVSNGLFTSVVDFGPAFDHQPRWLELAVKPAGSPDDFTVLSPRQPVTIAPKADFANRAGTLTGSIDEGKLPLSVMRRYVDENVTGLYHFTPLSGNPPFTVNSSVLVPNLNADQLDGLSSTDLWKTGGNAGTTAGAHFLGTTDNQPLELWVNNQRALRIEPNATSPNVIGGCSGNFVQSGNVGSVIGGGGDLNNSNAIFSSFAAIAGGGQNQVGTNSSYSSIGGGLDNEIATDSFFSTIGGGSANNIGTNSGFSVISGGISNKISDLSEYSTIAGGRVNHININSDYSVIGGGHNNNIAAYSKWATISGGTANSVGTDTYYCVIGGGGGNNISNSAFAATISGGANNAIGLGAGYSSIGGGTENRIGFGATYATIPGGYYNAANANYAFAAGHFAKANHVGTFVWADSTFADFSSTAADQFLIRATGGVGINTASPQAPLHVWGRAIVNGADQWDVTNTEGDFRVGSDTHRFKIGVAQTGGGAGDIWMRAHGGTGRVFIKTPGGTTFYSNEGQSAGVSLAAGGTSWAVISDRNVKKDFAAVDSMTILEKLADMPITQWHYHWESAETTPHIGPMAQDFKAAFYPGSDDKSITTLEADGVALAAIQGLNQKVENGEQRAENRIKKLEAENAKLKTRLEKLEQLVARQLNGGVR